MSSVGRRLLFSVALMLSFCALWLFFAPHYVSEADRAIKCPIPIDGSFDPSSLTYREGDPSPIERQQCVASSRNRMVTGLMLLTTAVVAGVLAVVLFPKGQATGVQGATDDAG